MEYFGAIVLGGGVEGILKSFDTKAFRVFETPDMGVGSILDRLRWGLVVS